MLLIHGARAVLCHAKTKTAPAPDRLRAWAPHLERLRGHNKAAVALANKLARIAWAVWKYGIDFTAAPAAEREAREEDPSSPWTASSTTTWTAHRL
jgi:transposase